VKTLPSPAPLLIIVLPAAIDATTSGYLDPNTAAETIKGVLSTGTLGGWGIWDASHDYLVGTQLWSTQTYRIIVGKWHYPGRLVLEGSVILKTKACSEAHKQIRITLFRPTRLPRL
jgi:hypothetical protein